MSAQEHIDTSLDTLIHQIAEYRLPIVFVNILVQQLGAPVPGYPMLMITGALAARGELNGWRCSRGAFVLFDALGAAIRVVVGLALGCRSNRSRRCSPAVSGR